MSQLISWIDFGGLHVNRRGEHVPPARRKTDCENAIGAWAEKHTLGAQLGPPRRGRAGVTS
jgi:hypothetical protein